MPEAGEDADPIVRVKLGRRVKKRQAVRKQEGIAQRKEEQR